MSIECTEQVPLRPLRAHEEGITLPEKYTSQTYLTDSMFFSEIIPLTQARQTCSADLSSNASMKNFRPQFGKLYAM